jgi:hypothetical protein
VSRNSCCEYEGLKGGAVRQESYSCCSLWRATAATKRNIVVDVIDLFLGVGMVVLWWKQSCLVIVLFHDRHPARLHLPQSLRKEAETYGDGIRRRLRPEIDLVEANIQFESLLNACLDLRRCPRLLHLVLHDLAVFPSMAGMTFRVIRSQAAL